jgi:hypothetical protein
MEGKLNSAYAGSEASLPGAGAGAGARPGGAWGVLGAVAGWRQLATSWTGGHPVAVRAVTLALVAGLYHAYFFICLGRWSWCRLQPD